MGIVVVHCTVFKHRFYISDNNSSNTTNFIVKTNASICMSCGWHQSDTFQQTKSHDLDKLTNKKHRHHWYMRNNVVAVERRGIQMFPLDNRLLLFSKKNRIRHEMKCVENNVESLIKSESESCQTWKFKWTQSLKLICCQKLILKQPPDRSSSY